MMFIGLENRGDYSTAIGYFRKVVELVKDYYWIRKPKELLIPVLKDIVLDINIDERKIIIRPVGEWMDED